MAILVSACASVQDATNSDMGDLVFLVAVLSLDIRHLQDRIGRSFVHQSRLVGASLNQQFAEVDVTCCGGKLAKSA